MSAPTTAPPGRPASPEHVLARVVLPPDEERRRRLRLAVIRILVAASAILGVNYLVWRWTSSLNMAAWWIAVPLALAETYSLLDSLLFGFTVWRLKERGPAPPPVEGTTVDVFITTYNEPIDLVMATAVAARDIRWPHRTWILDDGARPEMQAAAEAAGIGYVVRSEDWRDMPRHAKAGNLNNALLQTDGELLLILDADQVPHPEILTRTIGWFRDERVALVQTPQYFVNVDEADPLGSQAPLFYGPIQQGKDGWNAAFFCGSNAILRREALMQLGIVGYVRELERSLRRAARQAESLLRRSIRDARREGDLALADHLRQVEDAVRQLRRDVDDGLPLSEVTWQFQRRLDDVSAAVVADDVAGLAADLAAIESLGLADAGAGDEDHPPAVDLAGLDQLQRREWSPLAAVESVRALFRSLDVDLADEAQPLMPMATISVTEDMATAMRLHGMGWRSVYHHEILAHGLAPEDLGSMLHQRLRWAQGTLQVMLRENPFVQRGLSLAQRLMYGATMWSYLSGFAALAYVIAPVLYLFAGVRPVESFGEDFLWHLLPYLLVNQAVFFVVGYGVRTWRGQQYSLALFPLWIKACWTAIGNVWFGKGLGFVVTPKVRQEGAPPWHVVRPQLFTMGLLAAAIVAGLVRLALGVAPSATGTFVNVAWAVYDLVVFSVIIDAALYRGPQPEDA